MARKTGFLAASFADRFKEAYPRLSSVRQRAADKVIMALIKQQPTPGMRVKPIQPEKYYNEARINDGDRLIHRIEDRRLWIIDLVEHNDISRYGKKVPGLFGSSGSL